MPDNWEMFVRQMTENVYRYSIEHSDYITGYLKYIHHYYGFTIISLL